MKIYTALQIGEYHLDHCEDFLTVQEMGSGKICCAVMDGCTTDETIDPIHYLLQNRQELKNDDMLYLKLKRLEHVHGVKPTDDIAMVRICKF